MIRTLVMLVQLVMPLLADAAPKLLSPKHSAFVSSLGTPMLIKAAATPALALQLTWDYPPDQISNVVFEVWSSVSVSQAPPLPRYDAVPNGFTLHSVVDAPPVAVGGQPWEFFIVRAKDFVSGVYSNWNVK